MFDAPLLCYAGFQLSRIYWNLKTENKEQRTENWNHSEYVVGKIVKLYFRQSEKVKQSLARVCFILETYKIVRKI